MIISVHLPKTAGTSFIKTLKSVYGNNVLEDYADKRLNTALFKRRSIATLKRIRNRYKDFKDTKRVHVTFAIQTP